MAGMWSAQAQLAPFQREAKLPAAVPPGENPPKLRFGVEERKLRLRTPHELEPKVKRHNA